MLSNIRSLVKNNDSFVLALIRGNYDLALVTESWLSTKNDIAPLLGIANSQYSCIRCDRVRRKGGGVFVLVKNSIPFTCIFKESLSDGYEICVCDVLFEKTSLRIILVYRTPSCNARNSALLRKAISDHCCCDGPSLVLGDFNLADMEWYSRCDDTLLHSAVTKDFIDMFVSHNFSQLVDKPTRGESFLDLVFCNCDRLVTQLSVTPPIGNSDHATIDFLIDVGDHASKPRLVRDFASVDFPAIERYLSDIDWFGSFGSVNSVNEMYEMFLFILHHVMDLFIPMKEIKSKARRLPAHLERMVLRRGRLWEVAIKDDCSRAWDSYKVFNAKVEKAISKYNAHLEDKIIQSSDPTKLYTYIRKRMKESKSIPSLVISESQVAKSDKEKAELFASEFQKSFAKPSCLRFDNVSTLFPTMEPTIWFNRDEIADIILKWPSSASLTPDFIPLNFIKRIIGYIASPLEYLFNLSYMYGEVPSRWRHSFIVPIPKKPPLNSTKNYRPVSITSIFARTFEKILKNHLVAHLVKHNIISSNQHGFCKGRSIETALLSSFNDWTKALDEGKRVDVVYFDFAKAFDRVPSLKLIQKLESIGIHHLALRWIQNFLRDRTYQVHIGNEFSSVRNTSSGVPQGGVLSPLLFLIYSHELPSLLSRYDVSCTMYADDIKVHKVIDKAADHDTLQTAIDQVYAWSVEWELPLAANKSKVLIIGNNRTYSTNYTVGSETLEIVNEVNDLGFRFNEKLSFDAHYKYIVCRALHRTYNLFKAVRSRNPATLIKAYKTYVRPLLETGTTVFSPYKKKDIDLLESAQNNFTRKLAMRCSGLSYEFIPDGVTRRRVFGLPSLFSRRKRNDMVMAFKILTGRASLCSSSLFSVANSRTRGSSIKIRAPSSRKQVRAKFFSLRVVPLLNKIINEDFLHLSLSSFRRRASKIAFAEVS